MILEFHDSETGNTLAGRVPVDYDYQAEEWVKDAGFAHENEVRFVLKNDDGSVRAVWEKNEAATEITLTECNEFACNAFGGDWQKGTVWTREQWERQYQRV